MIALPGMNNEKLGELIRAVASAMHDDQLGFWKFDVGNRIVFVITDETHNRMRIMSPVVDLESITDELQKVLLEANFDRALDARYCVNNETVWSAFLHPLAELGDQQFQDALSQVVTLAENFGTTFTSSDLVFGG